LDEDRIYSPNDGGEGGEMKGGSEMGVSEREVSLRRKGVKESPKRTYTENELRLLPSN